MSITEHKKAILEGNGMPVMDIFHDEFTPMLERRIWQAYKSGDQAEIGRAICVPSQR